jgi:addiction module HigA family antidote
MTAATPPGVLLRIEVIEALGMEVTEAARRLNMTRPALSRVLNGKAAISADLADKLERVGVGRARFWSTLQARYDLQQAQATPAKEVEAFDVTPAMRRRWNTMLKEAAASHD